MTADWLVMGVVGLVGVAGVAETAEGWWTLAGAVKARWAMEGGLGVPQVGLLVAGRKAGAWEGVVEVVGVIPEEAVGASLVVGAE